MNLHAGVNVANRHPNLVTMKKRLFPALLVSALIVASAFAASCGGDDDGTAPTIPGPTPTGQPTKSATAAAPAAATKEPATLENATMTPSGLKYVDEVVGTGPSPRNGQKVTVHYTGTLTNGTKFDSSRDKGQPFTFTIGVGQVIKGWDEGVLTMKVGGRRILYIPSGLAYGARSPGAGIPPNADLIFDVELLSVQQ